MLDSASANGNTLSSVLGTAKYNMLKKDFPSLANFLISFVSYDYNSDYEDKNNVFGYSNGGKNRMLLVSSLVYNLSECSGNLACNHSPEYYLPALMCNDSFYSSLSDSTDLGVFSFDQSDLVCEIAGYDKNGRFAAVYGNAFESESVSGTEGSSDCLFVTELDEAWDKTKIFIINKDFKPQNVSY